MQVVDQDSACFIGEDDRCLDASHVMMNKFHGPTDANYGLVRDKLQEMAAEAHNIAASQRSGGMKRVMKHQIPRKLSLHYIARPNITRQVIEYFKSAEGGVKRFVLWGMGGVG